MSTPVLRDEHGELSLELGDGTVQSRMRRAEPARLVLEYTRLMMGFLLFHPAPTRIAMIGLGGGSLAKYCAWKLPDADFTAIEISPAVIALRDAFGIPRDGPRFRVLCDDGADFVRREVPALDVLLVDAFTQGGRPDGLRSAAFHRHCRARLAPGGVLVVNRYTDDAGADGPLDPLRDAFAGRMVVVRGDACANEVAFAGRDAPFPPAFGDLVQRLRALDAAHPVGLDVTLRKVLAYEAPRPTRRDHRR